VDKFPKLRLQSIAQSSFAGWLIVVLAVGDVGLIAFYESDIVRSWPAGDWPGAESQINWPAALFWSGLLICLALFVCREIAKRKDDRHVKRRTRVVNCIVWTSIVAIVFHVWQWNLIEHPLTFWGALTGLLIFSAAFASAETAFTKLQSNDMEVSKKRKEQPDVEAKTDLQMWYEGETNPSKFFGWRYRQIEKNVSEGGFATLLPFLLVMNSVANLGGMYMIGKGLKSGDISNRFSLVISAVIVVIIGEVAAKYFAWRFSAKTAALTVIIIAPLKPLVSWYTSGLVIPVEAAIKKWTARA
jgi:hypothetical protein